MMTKRVELNKVEMRSKRYLDSSLREVLKELTNLKGLDPSQLSLRKRSLKDMMTTSLERVDLMENDLS